MAIETVEETKAKTGSKTDSTVKVTLEIDRDTGNLVRVYDEKGETAKGELGWPGWFKKTHIVGVLDPTSERVQTRHICATGKHVIVNGVHYCI